MWIEIVIPSHSTFSLKRIPKNNTETITRSTKLKYNIGANVLECMLKPRQT